MNKGINKWIGIGNCCKDPETRYLASGKAVTNITIACNDSYKDKQTGQVIDTTEFVRVVFFNKLAEIAGEYLRKGAKVYCEGVLKTRKWQDQNGQDRYTTEIVAIDMQMLDSKQSEGQTGSQQRYGQHAGHQSSDAARAHYAPQDEPTQGPQGADSSSSPEFDLWDTTIPF